VAERRAAIARYTLNAELGRLIARGYGDPKPNMKLARVENAHAKSAFRRSGALHAFIHEPKLPIAIEKVFKPNTCNLMRSGTTEQGEECLAHPVGQFKISGVELKRLAAEKYIECAPTPLVWLEERYVRKRPSSSANQTGTFVPGMSRLMLKSAKRASLT
jgi:hypothetical protein